MPALDIATPFDPTLDSLSEKIQRIRDRKAHSPAEATDIDDAMHVVGQGSGRQEAAQADMDLIGFSRELTDEGADLHALDPRKVADLIADPFADE